MINTKIYGPTNKGKYYISIYYHKKNSIPMRGKTRWIIDENEEYNLFERSDNNDWYCMKLNGYISIDENLTVVGENGEFLSFFPKPSNSSDPYHGFPIKSNEKLPSDEILDNWETNNIITSVMKRRIERLTI